MEKNHLPFTLLCYLGTIPNCPSGLVKGCTRAVQCIYHYITELQNPVMEIIMFVMFIITLSIPVPKAKIHHLPLLERCWEGSFSFRKLGPLLVSRKHYNHGLFCHPQICKLVRKKASTNLALKKTWCQNLRWKILTIFWTD